MVPYVVYSGTTSTNRIFSVFDVLVFDLMYETKEFRMVFAHSQV